MLAAMVRLISPGCFLLVRLLLGMLACPIAGHAEVSFWVWNRPEVLSASEIQGLKAAGIRTLYWHCAEIDNHGGSWVWKRLPKLPQKSTDGLRIVPVIRLESSVANPFAKEAADVLVEKLAGAFRTFGADEWQLDYDAPDRLVADYAGFLGRMRPLAPKLSSTALAGWIRLPSFGTLQASVAELVPMFYDLEPDTASALRPLVETESTRALMAEWTRSCRVPWRAGLPWFARLTIYGTDGRSRGHFRQWSWDDVVFRREAAVERPTRDGLTPLRIDHPMLLENKPVGKGELLVARWPDLAALRVLESTAGRDVVYFRLPDSSASSGWSLGQFIGRMGEPTAPAFSLRLQGNHLILTNAGNVDLPARMVENGATERGYALEVDAPAPVFREAQAGGFWRMAAHAQPDAERPIPVPVAASTRLTFWFSALPAGSERRSGFLQLAPGVASSELRWRIVQSDPPSLWNPLVLPP